MATKNISITEEAYMRLATRRKGKESFSEIINRITGRQDLLQFAGVLSESSARRMEKHIQKQRKVFNREGVRRRKRWIKELTS